MSTAKPPCPGYQTDAELLKAFIEKLQPAYKCLLYICYNQIIPSLRRKNFRIQEDIEDIVIGALTEVILKTEVYGSVKRLLWTISCARVVDWIRKRASYNEEGHVVVKEIGGDNWDLFETLLISADPMLLIEFEDKYRFFLKELTPREKEVLELLSEGKSVEVIAAMLGISVGAVGNIITRIKNAFNDFFGLKS